MMIAAKSRVLLAAGAAALLCFGFGRSLALSPTTTDPRAVMEAVDKRPKGDKVTARLQMVIQDPTGSKRVRLVRTRSLDFKGGKRQLLFFEQPADVRNTGLLTIDYDDGNKVDDQWLYLPSLRKSTRISSSDKSGSFMGSDLSFSDMTGQDPVHFDYQLIKQSATVAGEECWLIGAKPKTEKAKEETGYVKSMVWVSKSKLMPMQAKHWVRQGLKIKLMKFDKFAQIDGIWFAHKIMARTLQSGKPLSTTILAFSKVKFNDPRVKTEDFTQRRLEQGL
jgi:outer membrane lipoprotein-sorting protein